MKKFELIEVDKDFYAKLQLRDIARLDIASSVGLSEESTRTSKTNNHGHQ